MIMWEGILAFPLFLFFSFFFFHVGRATLFQQRHRFVKTATSSGAAIGGQLPGNTSWHAMRKRAFVKSKIIFVRGGWEAGVQTQVKRTANFRSTAKQDKKKQWPGCVCGQSHSDGEGEGCSQEEGQMIFEILLGGFF